MRLAEIWPCSDDPFIRVVGRFVPDGETRGPVTHLLFVPSLAGSRPAGASEPAPGERDGHRNIELIGLAITVGHERCVCGARNGGVERECLDQRNQGKWPSQELRGMPERPGGRMR